MRIVKLHRMGMDVSCIAYGTWQFSGQWGPVDEGKAVAAVHRARELGVNLFDTAQAYGFGAAERLLARALADELSRNRESVFLATKGGLRLDRDRMVRDSSPAWLRRGIEESLAALGVDYIDLYQIHYPDYNTPIAESAECLAEYVAQGVVRHVGVSNFTVDQIAAFETVLPVESLQAPYHLFRRGIEADVLPYVKKQEIAVLAYGPLAHGLLGGRMSVGSRFADSDWRSHSSEFVGEGFEQNLRVVAALTDLARRLGATTAQLAVAWVLSRSEVQVAIVGSLRSSDLEEIVVAGDITLSESDLKDIESIVEGARPIGGASPEGFG